MAVIPEHQRFVVPAAVHTNVVRTISFGFLSPTTSHEVIRDHRDVEYRGRGAELRFMDLALAGVSFSVPPTNAERGVLFALAEFAIRSGKCGPMHRSNPLSAGAMRTPPQNECKRKRIGEKRREFVGKKERLAIVEQVGYYLSRKRDIIDDICEEIRRKNFSSSILSRLYMRMPTSKVPVRCKLKFDQTIIEQLKQFKYLGTDSTSFRNLACEVRDIVWRNIYLKMESKVRVYKSATRPVMTYAAEARPDTSKTQQIM
ncbi:hypothetical protein Trydic_g14474 [Trypoxylus dichotomus]